MKSIVAVVCWALLGAVPAPQSQRLVQLAAVADSQQASDDFWREIDAQGTPLIERIPGKPDRVMMTFLWRAEDARAELNIGVVGVNKLSFEDRVDTMSRLGKSDVWYRNYEVESSARFQYFLAWPEGRTPDASVLERYTLENGSACGSRPSAAGCLDNVQQTKGSSSCEYSKRPVAYC